MISEICKHPKSQRIGCYFLMGGVNMASRSFEARERGRETKPVSNQLAAAGRCSLSSADQQPEPSRVQSSPVHLFQPAAGAGGRLADIW